MATMEALNEGFISNIVLWNNYQKYPSKDVFGFGIRNNRFVLIKTTDSFIQRCLFILLRCLNFISRDSDKVKNLHERTLAYLKTPEVLAFLKLLAGVEQPHPLGTSRSEPAKERNYDANQENEIPFYHDNIPLGTLPVKDQVFRRKDFDSQKKNDEPALKVDGPQNSIPVPSCNHLAEIEQLKNDKRNLADALEDQASLKEEQAKLKEELERLKQEKQQKQTELDKVNQEKNKLAEENTTLNDNLNTEKKKLEEEQKKLEQEKAKLLKEIEEKNQLMQSLEELRNTNAQQMVTITNLTKQLSEAKKLFEQQLKSLEEQIQQKLTRIQELEKELQAAKDLAEQQKKSLAELSRQLEGILLLQPSKGDSSTDFTTLLQNAKKQILNLEKRKSELIKLIENLENPDSSEFQKLLKDAISKKGALNMAGKVINSFLNSNNKSKSTTSLLASTETNDN